MKILNLYSGVGGNSYLWEGHEVTAVEYDPRIADIYRRLRPDDHVVVADAHECLLEHHEEYDFVWSSPPCQSHTKMVKATRHESQSKRYPDMRLMAEIIYLEHFFSGLWVVENVEAYYGNLIPEGVYFTKVGRHCFWSNFPIQCDDVTRPKNFINLATVAGKETIQDWLGLPRIEENIYVPGRHCPAQIYRNAVHPTIGLQILRQAESFAVGQMSLLEEQDNG